jgi:predicted metal-dependent hydrolase
MNQQAAPRVSLPADREAHYTVPYGTTLIHYSLRFARRKTLGITVHPDCTVSVVAPLNHDLNAIAEKVQQRSRWILKQQRKFERYLPHLPARQYVSGETHLYLGKQYRLKVMEADIPAVKLARGRFCIFTPHPTNKKTLQQQLDTWYKAKARQVFSEQLEHCLKRVAVIGIEATPALHIRTMQKRWGSCSASGIILLNLKLIQARKALIDYIIIHELCHLKEHNHSRAYYQLLDRVMPDWQARREELNLTKVA